jgi:hypothetical protein
VCVQPSSAQPLCGVAASVELSEARVVVCAPGLFTHPYAHTVQHQGGGV